MGHVKELIRLYYRNKSLNIEALIDTGATTVVLPRSVAKELGVEILGEMNVELAEGTTKRVSYGVVEVELSGRRAPVFCSYS